MGVWDLLTRLTTSTPDRFYHGTSVESLISILQMDALYVAQDGDYGASLCITLKEARRFAVAQENSFGRMGAVLVLDGLMTRRLFDASPYDGAWRTKGIVRPLSAVLTGILVNRVDLRRTAKEEPECARFVRSLLRSPLRADFS